MMKKLSSLLLVAVLLPSLVAATPIVNNSGQSAEDSISFAFVALDSLGNPTTADSFFVLVIGPSGDSVFAEAITSASTRLDSAVVNGAPVYIYRASVADIDGAGAIGGYAVSILARTGSFSLTTPFMGSFQIVDWELDDLGDTVGLAARYASAALDSLGRCLEALDTLSIGTATVDSATVARAVWNTPQTNHTTSGTFGRYLDTEISGIGSGSGAFAFSLVTMDSSAEQPVGGARLAVRTLDQSGLIAVGGTNSEGRCDFNLDADSFLVIASAPGFIFGAYDTLVVMGSGTDTVRGYRLDAGEPTSPSLCRVYGYVYSVTGIPSEEATVTAYLPRGVTRQGQLIVSPFPTSTTTDSSGYFYLDLIPSDSLTGDDTRYEITIDRPDGTILRKRLTIPDATSWQLTW